MTDKIEQAKQKMIQNIEKKTGTSIGEWTNLARNSGFKKVGERIKYLKSEQGLTHGYANFISLMARDLDEEAAGVVKEDPIDSIYSGPKASLRPIYDLIIEKVNRFGPDVVESPKKAYVSLRRKKQFGIIQPSTKTRVDVGLVLKGKEIGSRLEAAGSWNSMCTHRVRLESVESVDDELFNWLKEAYDAA